jgi:hypothetical protein
VECLGIRSWGIVGPYDAPFSSLRSSVKDGNLFVKDYKDFDAFWEE